MTHVETARTASPARDLLRFGRELDLRGVPDDVLVAAKTLLLDAIGCGVFGAGQPWSRIVLDEVLEEKGRGPCSALGSDGAAVPAAAAALCNGTSMHGFELDDVMPRALVHPGCVIVPAVLAAAEAVDAPGSEVLRAVVAGYEAIGRISLALGTKPSEIGFHKTGIAGPAAAALASSLLFGLGEAETACAIGIACSAAGGIKSFAAGSGGGMVKRLHAGRAAEAGVRAASLARRGFTGPATALDGKFGLVEVYAGTGGDNRQLSSGLGDHWLLREVATKFFPVCGGIQGPVQLMLELRGARPLEASQVRNIVVGTSAFAHNHNGNYEPHDTMEAQYSLPYCVALAALADPAAPEGYEQAALAEPQVRALARRIDMVVDPDCDRVHPGKVASRMRLVLADGSVRQAETFDPRGSPLNPWSRAELQTKFRRLAGAARLEPEPIVDFVNEMEHEPGIRRLGRLLAGHPSDLSSLTKE
jgi:2-methylcitrate dehydratase PrpD